MRGILALLQDAINLPPTGTPPLAAEHCRNGVAHTSPREEQKAAPELELPGHSRQDHQPGLRMQAPGSW